MKRHEKTWREFLTKMTVLGQTIGHVPQLTADSKVRIELVAEALALAAPQGPLGFPCQDGCCMPDQEILHGLTRAVAEAISPQFITRPNYSWSDFVQDVYSAMKRDMKNESAQKYVAQWPSNFAAQLAQWKVMVTPASTAVIQARTIFPNTWALIEEKTK